MNPRCSPSHVHRGLAVAILLAAFAEGAAPAVVQPPSPYVFFLFDTSASMNYSPPCTQSQIDLGACSFLCPTGDCFVPMQGDDPASKFYQLKSALFTSIDSRDDLLLGFAGLNQDTFGVRAKHWIYSALNNGPTLGTGSPYPAAGADEVFGLTWTCDTGSNDNEIGCYAASPADLNDPWELARVQRLPKGGISYNQNVDVYIRTAGLTYRARYTPTGTAVPGASLISTNVTLVRCNNAPCSTNTAVGTAMVTWGRVGEFVSWDSADPGVITRTNPMLAYFAQPAPIDANTTNTCTGWEPNDDSTVDRYPNSAGYLLHFPTLSSDPRGASFTVGDVIPLDWLNTHKLDIEHHLAPNRTTNPTATPDFRIATYLNNGRLGADTFLHLKDENSRPLIASGATPLAGALTSFRTWYSGCPGTCTPAGWQAVAAAQDPDWNTRHVSVVLLTDGEESCGGDPCAQASALYSLYGVRTFVVAFGMQQVAGSTFECMAANGGTTAYYPQTQQELIDDLNLIYTAAANP